MKSAWSAELILNLILNLDQLMGGPCERCRQSQPVCTIELRVPSVGACVRFAVTPPKLPGIRTLNSPQLVAAQVKCCKSVRNVMLMSQQNKKIFSVSFFDGGKQLFPQTKAKVQLSNLQNFICLGVERRSPLTLY